MWLSGVKYGPICILGKAYLKLEACTPGRHKITRLQSINVAQKKAFASFGFDILYPECYTFDNVPALLRGGHSCAVKTAPNIIVFDVKSRWCSQLFIFKLFECNGQSMSNEHPNLSNISVRTMDITLCRCSSSGRSFFFMAFHS